MVVDVNSYTEIQKLLKDIGTEVTFPVPVYPVTPATILYAIQGFRTSALQDDHSFNAVTDTQNFNFFFSTQDVKTYSSLFNPDNTFTLTDGVNVYTFLILNSAVPQMDGFSKVACNIIGAI